MRVYASSDVSAATLRDGHRLKFCSKGQRYASPGFGDNSRSLPWADVTCPQCIEDCNEPRHGFNTDPSKVPLTSSEQDYLRGKSEKQRSTIQSLMDQLAELDA